MEKKAYVNNESLDTTSQAVKNKKSYAEAVNSQNEKIKRGEIRPTGMNLMRAKVSLN